MLIVNDASFLRPRTTRRSLLRETSCILRAKRCTQLQSLWHISLRMRQFEGFTKNYQLVPGFFDDALHEVPDATLHVSGAWFPKTCGEKHEPCVLCPLHSGAGVNASESHAVTLWQPVCATCRTCEELTWRRTARPQAVQNAFLWSSRIATQCSDI
jgi:hypothetical protein